MGMYGRARQATDDNIMLRMRTARWIPKDTNAHSEYVTIYGEVNSVKKDNYKIWLNYGFY